MNLNSQRGSFSVEALLVFTVCFGIMAGGVRLFCALYDQVSLESMAWEAADQAAASWIQSMSGLYASEKRMIGGKLEYSEKIAAGEDISEEGSKDLPDWLEGVRFRLRESGAKLLLPGEMQWTLTHEEGLMSGSMKFAISRKNRIEASAQGMAPTQTPVVFIRKIDLILEQSGSLLEVIQKEMSGFLPSLSSESADE